METPRNHAAERGIDPHGDGPSGSFTALRILPGLGTMAGEAREKEKISCGPTGEVLYIGQNNAKYAEAYAMKIRLCERLTSPGGEEAFARRERAPCGKSEEM